MLQDIQCPAPIDATEVEQVVCADKESPKPLKPRDGDVKPLGGGGGTTNPPEPTNPKPKG